LFPKVNDYLMVGQKNGKSQMIKKAIINLGEEASDYMVSNF
jgi:hypothetical protein